MEVISRVDIPVELVKPKPVSPTDLREASR
jgi:hypothetical protein